MEIRRRKRQRKQSQSNKTIMIVLNHDRIFNDFLFRPAYDGSDHIWIYPSDDEAYFWIAEKDTHLFGRDTLNFYRWRKIRIDEVIELIKTFVIDKSGDLQEGSEYRIMFDNAWGYQIPLFVIGLASYSSQCVSFEHMPEYQKVIR